MATIFYKQPNGRYCRYSTIVEDVTDYNMNDTDIIKWFVNKAIDEAKEFLDKKDKNMHEFGELELRLQSNKNPDKTLISKMKMSEDVGICWQQR